MIDGIDLLPPFRLPAVGRARPQQLVIITLSFYFYLTSG